MKIKEFLKNGYKIQSHWKETVDVLYDVDKNNTENYKSVRDIVNHSYPNSRINLRSMIPDSDLYDIVKNNGRVIRQNLTYEQADSYIRNFKLPKKGMPIVVWYFSRKIGGKAALTLPASKEDLAKYRKEYGNIDFDKGPIADSEAPFTIYPYDDFNKLNALATSLAQDGIKNMTSLYWYLRSSRKKEALEDLPKMHKQATKESINRALAAMSPAELVQINSEDVDWGAPYWAIFKTGYSSKSIESFNDNSLKRLLNNYKTEMLRNYAKLKHLDWDEHITR